MVFPYGNRNVVTELLFTIVVYTIGSIVTDMILGRLRDRTKDVEFGGVS